MVGSAADRSQPFVGLLRQTSKRCAEIVIDVLRPALRRESGPNRGATQARRFDEPDNSLPPRVRFRVSNLDYRLLRPASLDGKES